MATLMQAHRQWASRPDDQRFTSLTEMLDHFRLERQQSRALGLASRDLRAEPVLDDESRRSLAIVGPGDAAVAPTHWAFGQLASLAGAPAGYMRKLPSDIAADCINYGLHEQRTLDIGTLLRGGGDVPMMAAATGPNYGRVWNDQVIGALVDRFGNGIDGEFTVPGEFGKAIDVNKSNTTLFGSDRDMWIFLADEKNRIEVPSRRPGETGQMARGFFLWNSEVGSASLGIATFLFDYVCCNRMVWGAQGYEEIRIKHTSGAPHRWIEEAAPALESYAQSSTAGITKAIEDARAKRIGDPDEVLEFLSKRRFTKTQAQGIMAAHMAEEQRPIETLWDASVGATAYAKGIKHQDARVGIEREAGRIMAMAG